jgi:hypothetical protein
MVNCKLYKSAIALLSLKLSVILNKVVNKSNHPIETPSTVINTDDNINAIGCLNKIL